jgi:hypothetical protein
LALSAKKAQGILKSTFAEMAAIYMKVRPRSSMFSLSGRWILTSTAAAFCAFQRTEPGRPKPPGARAMLRA